MMENHNWSQIKGSSSAPYINKTLLPMGGHAEQYYNPPGIHPSLPNYLWLEAGTNFGVLNDNDPSAEHQSTKNHLVTLLTKAGYTWKAYEENISGTTCPLTNSGNYAVRHEPFTYFDDITNNLNPKSQNCIQHLRPFTQLATDLKNNTITNYNFITPNVIDDMHNGTIQQGDTWLKNNLPTILNSQAYKTSGVIIITWDEGEGGDGPIGMIVLSPLAKKNYSNSIHYGHSSTLKTIEEIFGVTPLLGGAAKATDLSAFFTVNINHSGGTNKPSPSQVMPSNYCLGGTCGSSPSPSLAAGRGGGSGNNQSSPPGKVHPSASPSQNPCITNQSVTAGSVSSFDKDNKNHTHKNGLLSQFILLLLQFIINLLNQLTGGNIPPITTTPGADPCPSASPSNAPSAGVSSQPKVSKTSPSPASNNLPKLTNSTICNGAPTQGKYKHIIWIVFENTQSSTALSKMPYLSKIANQCGLATNFWAETHPSLPNYIAMTSGSTQGITTDSGSMLGVNNIYNQVKQKGLQWRQYAFGMPSNCYTKNNPPAPNAIFTAHHVAAIYYSDIVADCKSWVVPVGSSTKVSDPTDVTNSPLATALDTNTLPAFAILTPTDDGGNSTVGGEVDPNLGNQFLQRWIPRIAKSNAYKTGTVAIFITWDEPQDFKVIPPKQPIAFVVIAPSVKPGTKSGTKFTHYSMLKTTEELLGITTYLGHAGDPTTSDLRSAFNL